MKEATGELNMTVVTVVAIAAVAAFFYAFVWPGIKSTINRNTYCSQAFGCECTGDTCACRYCKNDDCSEVEDITCPNEGDSATDTPTTTP